MHAIRAAVRSDSGCHRRVPLSRAPIGASQCGPSASAIGTVLGIMRPMPPLRAKERGQLPDSAFAYIDSRGRRRLPIHDASHVRNALARFSQVAFEDEDARPGAQPAA